MTPFKTTEEIYRHLLDGGKITNPSDEPGAILSLVDGTLTGRKTNGDQWESYWHFGHPFNWYPYHEPEIYEVDVIWTKASDGNTVPCDIVSPWFDWESLIGKRTKLRIEIIK